MTPGHSPPEATDMDQRFDDTVLSPKCSDSTIARPVFFFFFYHLRVQYLSKLANTSFAVASINVFPIDEV